MKIIRTIIAALAILSLVHATTFSAHADQEHIDFDNSTKQAGLVLWQGFFQKFVETTTAVQPGSYVAELHACWFQFFIGKWNDDDSRYALRAIQNCPPELVTSFTFQITTADHGDDGRVYDTATAAATVKPAAVDDVVLTNVPDDANKLFGILIKDLGYPNTDAVWDSVTYAYTVERAGAGPKQYSPTGVLDELIDRDINVYQNDPSIYIVSGQYQAPNLMIENGLILDEIVYQRSNGQDWSSGCMIFNFKDEQDNTSTSGWLGAECGTHVSSSKGGIDLKQGTPLWFNVERYYKNYVFYDDMHGFKTDSVYVGQYAISSQWTWNDASKFCGIQWEYAPNESWQSFDWKPLQCSLQ